jgi:hypothetical protein
MTLQEQLLKLFDIDKSVIPTNNQIFSELPVYKHKWIPRGEVWLQDKNGKVIKKFKISL